MEWALVPMSRSDFGFFDRQRFLFCDWMRHFDDEFRAMDMHNSMLRFDRELERIRRDLFNLDEAPSGHDQVQAMRVENPYITDVEGNRKLALRYDVSKFSPEEISVKTTGNEVVVHAKHHDEAEGRTVHREFTRKFTLPHNVDPNALKATLSKDGVLHVEAPAPPAVEAPKENLVPIEQA